MMPTLRSGDYLLVRECNALKRPLARGDIVVVAFEGRAQGMLKRLIGLPREQVRLSEGMLFISGSRLVEPYLGGLPPYLGLDDSEFSLGIDEYFVMGDDRARSTDSRHYGPVYQSQIEGKVVLRVWPPSRLGRQ